MFACMYGQAFPQNELNGDDETCFCETLVNLAFTFSPLIERTSTDTVVLDIEGQDLLFDATHDGHGSAVHIADQIAQCAARISLKINIAVASNPDTAIHAARAFSGITVIPRGEELATFRNVSLKLLDYSLAGIDEAGAVEIRETFALWGLRTFGDFARLPIAGVAQRLGQAGVRLQQLAQGRSDRRLLLVQPPIGFEQSLDLEHAITELEPLSFVLARLLNQLCANLNAHAFATNELRLRFMLEDKTTHERTITLPVPMQNSKTFLRLCLLDLETHPPVAPVIGIALAAEPTKPRLLQNGLFIPLAPEPEKLELTLARLIKLVGEENVGSPDLLDTHRPDAFQMKRFKVDGINKKRNANQRSAIRNPQCVIGFRRFRPPLPAQVVIISEHPARINALRPASSDSVRGKIVKASGPWRASGDWWRSDVWARDEWDVTVADANSQGEIICRLFRELISEEWFVEGIYD